MRTRLVALALAVLSAILYLGAARPWTARALALADEYRLLREERRAGRAALADLERRDALLRRTVAALGAAAPVSNEGLRQVRRQVVQAVDAARLSGVRLGVRAGRPGGSAAVQVSGEGPVEQVLGLTGWLSDLARGTVLVDVRLSRQARGAAALQMNALGFPVGPR